MRNLFKKKDNGQSFVEFALVLPILILLVLGIIQFGIVFYGQVTITSAAREGARMSSIGKSYEVIETKISEIVSIPFLNVDLDEIRFYPDPLEPRVFGDPVSVVIPASVNIIVPFLERAVGDVFNISAKSEMRYQHYSENDSD